MREGMTHTTQRYTTNHMQLLTHCLESVTLLLWEWLLLLWVEGKLLRRLYDSDAGLANAVAQQTCVQW